MFLEFCESNMSLKVAFNWLICLVFSPLELGVDNFINLYNSDEFIF